MPFDGIVSHSATLNQIKWKRFLLLTLFFLTTSRDL